MRAAIPQPTALGDGARRIHAPPPKLLRRMEGAVPPFLIDVPEYHERSKRVRDMYATPAAADAWTIAHSLRIGYIYVDRVERQAYGDRLAKFEDPKYFTPAFRNGAVQIYKVN